MNIRTDLVLENQKIHEKHLSGIEQTKNTIGNSTLYTVKICTEEAAKKLQKPKGTYCTVEFPRLDFVCDTEDIIKATVKAFKTVFNSDVKNTLVVGLGNTDITPDALGPFACNRVLATRHLSNELKNSLGLSKLSSVCCLSPNVLGKTGIESYDLICAAVNKIKPDIIIAIDALAARSPQRLCRTIQISNSGICPGAGVNNSRKELSRDTIGVPVIAIGIPTVIDANSFFESFENSSENMMVTPKEIDLLIEKSADIISRAINRFLQPKIDIKVIESLT